MVHVPRMTNEPLQTLRSNPGRVFVLRGLTPGAAGNDHLSLGHGLEDCEGRFTIETEPPSRSTP